MEMDTLITSQAEFARVARKAQCISQRLDSGRPWEDRELLEIAARMHWVMLATTPTVALGLVATHAGPQGLACLKSFCLTITNFDGIRWLPWIGLDMTGVVPDFELYFRLRVLFK